MLLRAVVLTTSLLFAFTHAARAAQCKADFDGSGAVDVSEVIQAVNEALNGCGGAQPTATKKGAKTPTPTRTPTEPPAAACPYRFNQAVTADRFCGYGGTLADNCGDNESGVASGWTTSGTVIISIVDDGSSTQLAVYGTRTGPTTGSITNIAFSPDYDPAYSASGTLSIPSGPEFNIDVVTGTSCGTISVRGSFVQLLGDSAKSTWSPLSEMAQRHAAERRELPGAATNARAEETRALANRVEHMPR